MIDPGVRAHQEWLGLIQPVGLVVAPHALVAAQVELDRSLSSKWLTYDALLVDRDDERVLPSWPVFAREFLEWDPARLAGSGAEPLPPELTVVLPELETRLEPTYAVRDPHREAQWLLLITVVEPGANLDRAGDGGGASWNASPHDRFERLLRETKVPAGLLVSDDTIRFVHAPRGESSGWLSFPVAAMATPHGRPMLAALYELLKGWRLSRACPEARGLRRLLEDSRKYQNEVSTRLAEQVLGALYELGRGFQAADDAARGAALQAMLGEAPSEVYGGLITTIMRLVFVLYAEERGMLPQDATWVEHYGVGSLLERLRADRARYPDTMDQRYGAWPRLLSLFRILHDGASHEAVVIPSRAGELFDPDRYPFLEGRALFSRRVMGDRLTSVPRVSDGTIIRVLERLLVLDEERLSYRALDVEQIGSVYEAMMGFEVRAALGTSIAVRPKTRKPGTPSHPVVNLDTLLAVPGANRVKWLKEEAECELPAADAAALKAASDVNGLLAALDRRISPFTPQPVRLGGLVLSPTEERRRSGSHYTPRELTEPIVATTLRPLLEAFGPTPSPAQLLDLRVCDPAMGSGAFLVGACRHLGERVVEAWQREGSMPAIPADEDPQLYARRLVAQRCLFGVDRNPFAVQLAKLSLWLVTLARDHPFTFLDHALRHGDSLVGLTRAQIAAFHWELDAQPSFWAPRIAEDVKKAELQRKGIETLADVDNTPEKLRLLAAADTAVHFVRMVGDAVIASFFAEVQDKKRDQRRKANELLVARSLDSVLAGGPLELLSEALRSAEPPIVPFHWEVEFPEVFARPNPGFDAIVGNPPFMGGHKVWAALGGSYRDFLKLLHPGSGGKAVDLVAHFFRQAFVLLRHRGAAGLIATNTIAQGDTRAAGLRYICRAGGTIYVARRRVQWPGSAAVVVSVVHVRKGSSGNALLDGKPVAAVNSYLFPSSSDFDPQPLSGNSGLSYRGSMVYGMGFTFDDGSEKASPLSVMHAIIAKDPANKQRIFRFVGGEDINSSPTQASGRFIIDFAEMTLDEAGRWPDLLNIVRARVKPERDDLGGYGVADRRRENWWQFGSYAASLTSALSGMLQCLALSQVSSYLALSFQPTDRVFSHTVVVFPLEQYAAFCVLQGRSHELWARFFGSSMKDDLRYTPSDCFETFPFPEDWFTSADLERIGRNYYDFRAQLMIANDEGLTKTYNRFHDPTEHDPGILHLRELHDAMDRAVLDAYGWTDIQPTCEFLLDYEEDDEESSRRRKPWRYRWPDEIRDEVLARLLELNRRRATGRNP